MALQQKGETMFYNCTSLDHVVERCGGADIRCIFDDGTDYMVNLTPAEAAERMSGIVFRKYVGGERIRVRFRYDYTIGARLLEYVNYGNGFIERWTWHQSQE